MKTIVTKSYGAAQRGFTLIEMMIAVAIVGVIAAVALPAYTDYTRKAKMTEVIATASACRTAITEAYQMAPQNMPSANAWGCEATVAPSKYVRSIATSADGKITIVAQNFGDSSIDGRSIEMTPLKAVPVDPGDTMDMARGAGGGSGRRSGGNSGGPDNGSGAEASSGSNEEFEGLLPSDVVPMTAASPGVVYAWRCGPGSSSPVPAKHLPSSCRD